MNALTFCGRRAIFVSLSFLLTACTSQLHSASHITANPVPPRKQGASVAGGEQDPIKGLPPLEEFLHAKERLGFSPTTGSGPSISLDSVKQVANNVAQGKELVSEKGIAAFANLAKLYNQRDEHLPKGQASEQPRTLNQNMSFLQGMFMDQVSDTMIFSFESQGKYKEAADLVQKRISTLEAGNGDHSKDHALAASYYKYSTCIRNLGRQAEADQYVARAHAIEPNHF